MDLELSASLIAALYEAALDPSGLSALTQLVARVMNVESAGVWLNQNGQISDLNVTSDITESQKPYLDYYHRLDVWQSGEKSRRNKIGLDTVTLGTDFISESQLQKTEFFNDFARQYGMTNPLGAAIALSPDTTAFVSTNRQSVRFQLTDTDKLPLQTLLPHIKHALQLRMRMKLTTDILPQFFALEALTFGAIVCDRNGRIVFANSSAEVLIRQRRAIGFHKKHRALVASVQAESLKLEQMIDAAAVRNLSGSIVLSDRHAVPALIAMVTPLPAATFETVGPGHAFIALRELDAAPAFDAARLIELFRLSPTQAALAVALYGGKSFDEIALDRGVKVTTLRTHFNELLNRTGAKGLRDLTRLLGLIPPIR